MTIVTSALRTFAQHDNRLRDGRLTHCCAMNGTPYGRGHASRSVWVFSYTVAPKGEDNAKIGCSVDGGFTFVRNGVGAESGFGCVAKQTDERGEEYDRSCGRNAG